MDQNIQTVRPLLAGYKTQSHILCVLSTAVCVLTAGVMTGVEVPLDILLNIVITIKVCTCPLILAKRDYRDVSSKLPARASEKLGFLLLTFWIVFPTIIYGSLYLGQIAAKAIFDIKIPIEFLCLPSLLDVSGDTIWSSIGLGSNTIINLLLIASIIVVTLYYIIRAKKERTLAAVTSFVAIYMLILILLIGWKEFFSQFTSLTMAEETSVVINTYAAKATLIVIGIIGLIYLIKLCKRLKFSGF